jgi:hypothetical protein
VFCEPNPQSRYCYGNMTCFSSGTAAVYLFWVHDFRTCRRKGSRYSNLIFRCNVLSTTICRFASVLFFLVIVLSAFLRLRLLVTHYLFGTFKTFPN